MCQHGPLHRVHPHPNLRVDLLYQLARATVKQKAIPSHDKAIVKTNCSVTMQPFIKTKLWITFMWTIKIISLLLILTVTLLAGFYPFFKKLKTKQSHAFPVGESLAAGVFLGAGLIHMLGDAAQDFNRLHFDYPIAFLLAGTTFLLLLLLEHIGREVYEKKGAHSNGFAILATLMLSIHSFLAGAALGLSGSFSVVILILLAILAHKWAASFALAVQINKSQLGFKSGTALFGLFAVMVPIGIICGASATHALANYPLIAPIFSSLAAGTFLYLGTLHGLERAVLVKQCCNLKQYSFVMLGFIIMAVVAVWT